MNECLVSTAHNNRLIQQIEDKVLKGPFPILAQQFIVLHLQIDVAAQDHQQFHVYLSERVLELVYNNMSIILFRADRYQQLVDLHLIMKCHDRGFALFDPAVKRTTICERIISAGKSPVFKQHICNLRFLCLQRLSCYAGNPVRGIKNHERVPQERIRRVNQSLHPCTLRQGF